MIYKKNCKQIV